MHESDIKPAIYISYAWGSESEAIAESVEKEFRKRGLHIIRDKTDLGYKGKIRDFMEQIGRGKYVILIISNKYLRSENCMFELLQIFRNQDFYERIFPVVLDEVRIAKATDRLDLMKYWENEAANLDKKIRELKELSNIQGVTDDMNLYTEIRNNIARLTNILKDINTLNTDLHINSDFQQLFSLIQSKVRADMGSKSVRLRKKFIKYGALTTIALLLIVILFKAVKYGELFQENRNFKDSTAVDRIPNDSLLILEEGSGTDSANKEVLVKEKVDFGPSGVWYIVELIVPSDMAQTDVFVDKKLAEVIERGLISIKVRVRKKNGSHHFEISDGTETCFTDKLISNDNVRLTLCD
jgi:hypothetical protein